jgi:hypothetical protein
MSAFDDEAGIYGNVFDRAKANYAADRPVSDTDGLFDTTEPAMSNRIARFKDRLQESRSDRALQGAMDAAKELSVRVWAAQSPAELTALYRGIEEVAYELLKSSSDALTLREHWGDR